MPRLFAPAGRTGIIHSRNHPDRVYQIESDGTVYVEAHSDVSDLIGAGFSYSAVPAAAAAVEIADKAEAEAMKAAAIAKEKADHADAKRQEADYASERAREAHARLPADPQTPKAEAEAEVEKPAPALERPAAQYPPLEGEKAPPLAPPVLAATA